MTVSESNLTPGEILIAAREKMSLSLDEVAENTRIAPNMLRAIELDEYHKVSGDLYVKSFLRAYAQAVGLEPEELIEVYLAYTGEAGVESNGSQPSGWDEQDVKITKVGLPWGWIGLGVVVIVGGYLLFSFLGGDDSSEPETQITAASINADTEEGQVAAVPVPQPVKSISAGEDTLAMGWQLEKPVEEVKAEMPLESAAETGDSQLPEALAGDSALSFSNGRQWAYVVRLISTEPGVFAVKKDADSSFLTATFPALATEVATLPAGDIEAGKVYAVQGGFVAYWGADDHLSLRLGHVKDVEVTFNGVVQDVTRFRDGEEILLDSSRFSKPTGN